MFEQVRQVYGNKVFGKRSNRALPGKPVQISNIKKCVLLINYEAVQPHLLKELDRQLKAVHSGLDVRFISYTKNVVESEGFEQLELLTKKKVNWYFEPNGLDQYTCDLLIDLTQSQCLPLQFAGLQIPADFRIGLEQEWNRVYLDFMIRSGEEVKIKVVLEQLIKYLSKINSGKNAA